MPNQLVMVIVWLINLNVSCKLYPYSLQRKRSVTLYKGHGQLLFTKDMVSYSLQRTQSVTLYKGHGQLLFTKDMVSYSLQRTWSVTMTSCTPNEKKILRRSNRSRETNHHLTS